MKDYEIEQHNASLDVQAIDQQSEKEMYALQAEVQGEYEEDSSPSEADMEERAFNDYCETNYDMLRYDRAEEAREN
jgi:hypothetical protein